MDKFISSSAFPETVNPASYLFIFLGDEIALKCTDGKNSIPEIKELEIFEEHNCEKYYLGSFEGKDCFALILSDKSEIEHFEFIRLRKAYYVLEESIFWLAGRAFQTAFFHHNHRYCGVCSGKTEIKSDETARVCTKCENTYYPQQAPAVIVAVTKQDKLLLARANRFPTKMYSVLAGFVDPGESLEDCVRREIREECGISVKNIRYFGSQPWPFPNSLMVGFTAEYESGELSIDEKEIVDAAWYSYDNLPLIPDEVSIARKLINWFVEQHK